MPVPQSVIMDTSRAIALFKNITRKHNIDVIDIESLMAHIFSAIKEEESAKLNLYNVLDTFLYIASEDIDSIFDGDGYCGGNFVLFNDLLFELMSKIYIKVCEFQMYLGGTFPYKFVTILDCGSVLLERDLEK